jgi:molybdate transport system ATP-binding protein
VSLTFSAQVPERGVDVTFEVAEGETVALLGPNGAGKSTVLAVIAGLLKPTTGHVELDGRPLTVQGPGPGRPAWVPPHDRQVALLAQDPLLFPHLTALENVAFGPRSHGAGRSAARETARQWLGKVGVEELAARRPSQLSGGQAQRVAVARALAADPKLLLLDEPMAALDVAVAPAVRQTLREVLKERSAVIVTHDVLDALLLADRVIVIDGGLVVEVGPSSRVLAEPRSAFAARIAGLNLIDGTWQDGGLTAPTGARIEGTRTDPSPSEGDHAVAVFRPTTVSIFRTPPGGSPRNTLEVTVTHLEPLGDRVRVHAAGLSADITPQAAADLDLAPGTPVLFTIKANEIAIYKT